MPAACCAVLSAFSYPPFAQGRKEGGAERQTLTIFGRMASGSHVRAASLPALRSASVRFSASIVLVVRLPLSCREETQGDHRVPQTDLPVQN